MISLNIKEPLFFVTAAFFCCLYFNYASRSIDKDALTLVADPPNSVASVIAPADVWLTSVIAVKAGTVIIACPTVSVFPTPVPYVVLVSATPLTNRVN